MTTAESGALRILFRVSNARDVPSRFGGRDFDIMQTFAVEVPTRPPQRLVIGDVRQTACYIMPGGDHGGGVAFLTCYTDAVHFDVSFSRLTDGRVEVTATEQLELAPAPLRTWLVGLLHIPAGRPIDLSLDDEQWGVTSEWTHEPGL